MISNGSVAAHRGRSAAVFSIVSACALAAPGARADENGISFWLPGLFGSAAAPLTPGWRSARPSITPR